MNPLRAPIYVQAQDVARWILTNTSTWPDRVQVELRRQIETAALELPVEAALALSFTASRAAHRTRADETVERLRVLLRLATEIGRLSPRQLRFVVGELNAIGRMLGGWARAERLRGWRASKANPGRTGVEPRAAPTA